MKLSVLLAASTRPAWTARLVLYIAVIATASLLLQFAGSLVLW